jgi:succinoglycan biosynthesis protein ExoO
VPVYNSAATLRRCLESACAQTLRNIEIIVADDASTDDSAAVALSMAARDARIRVVQLERNGGKPHAMNMMMQQARGEWVAVLDADDAYTPDRLTRLIEAAEAAGTDMAADNLTYIDAGITNDAGGFGTVLRSAFDTSQPTRVIKRRDLVADADSYSDFDYGILKPVIRRRFVEEHGLAYHEGSRLAEDFTYLLEYMVAGGATVLVSRPMYLWTMPFGTISRQWTQTGAGAWRYDYRGAIAANAHYIAKMGDAGHQDVVAMLKRRGRQYRVMVHYIAAQREAAEGRRGAALLTLCRHPSTWSLLGRRIVGRLKRVLPAPAKQVTV